LTVLVGKGYTTDETHVQAIHHFAKTIRQLDGYKNNEPVLLILDNHVSRWTIEHVQECIDANITLLALPSSTSDLLQPLDLDVFGPLKIAFDAEVADFFQQHPFNPSIVKVDPPLPPAEEFQPLWRPDDT